MSTRTHRIHIVIVAGAVAAAGAVLWAHLAGTVAAQSLAAPTFTTAQQSAGDAIYKESCASCHGKNLDDGEFGPPLKDVEFRSTWFGKSADVLFTKIETMPPAAPGSLGAEKHASVLAYLMSQNQLVASTRALPTDLERLKGMLLPGATGGPSGGLSPNAVLPPPPHVVNPLDRYTPVTDAMLQNPPAGEWPSWRRGFDGQGFSPLRQITRANVGDLRVRVELGDAERSQREHAVVSRRRAVRARLRRQGPGARRVDGRSPVAVLAPPADGHAPQRQAGHRALRRQGLHRHVRHARRGARGQDGPRRLGCADRGCEAGLRPDRRRDGGQRQGHRHHDGSRARRQLHRRARCADRPGSLAVRHHAQGRRARREHLEQHAAREAQRRFGVGGRQLRFDAPDLALLRRRPNLRHRSVLAIPSRAPTTICCSRIRRSRSIPIPESWRGTFNTCRTISGTTTGRSRARWSN